MLKILKAALMGVGGLALLFVAIALLFGESREPGAPVQSVAREAARDARPAAPAAPARPADQDAFLAAIDAAADRFRAAPNDMARGGERPIRAQDICRALPNLAVRGWVGTIHALSATNSGDGVLSIRLDRRTTVGTWNNGLSDASARTLIPNGSALYLAVVQMRVGQTVVFDGAFLPNRDDCIMEKSLTVTGAMTSPEFAVRFSSVRLAP